MTLALVLLAAVVLLVPARSSRRAEPAAAGGQAESAGARPPRDRSLPMLVVAAISVAVACVLTLGVVRGAVAAVVVCPVVVLGARTLRLRTGHPPADPAVPLALDLVAAALRAGRPVADALLAGVPATAPATREGLARVAGLLRLGAPPQQAWAVLPRDGPLVPVAVAAVRSAASGVRLATSFERLAGQLRAEAATTAATRAQRAGVQAMGPLAACFLPSFVCLGVVPVVVGIAGTALHGVVP